VQLTVGRRDQSIAWRCRLLGLHADLCDLDPDVAVKVGEFDFSNSSQRGSFRFTFLFVFYTFRGVSPSFASTRTDPTRAPHRPSAAVLCSCMRQRARVYVCASMMRVPRDKHTLTAHRQTTLFQSDWNARTCLFARRTTHVRLASLTEWLRNWPLSGPKCARMKKDMQSCLFVCAHHASMSSSHNGQVGMIHRHARAVPAVPWCRYSVSSPKGGVSNKTAGWVGGCVIGR
jgi:hypothetical protein